MALPVGVLASWGSGGEGKRLGITQVLNRHASAREEYTYCRVRREGLLSCIIVYMTIGNQLRSVYRCGLDRLWNLLTWVQILTPSLATRETFGK